MSSTEAASLHLEPVPQAPPAPAAPEPRADQRTRWLIGALAVVVGGVYFCSNPEPADGYSQTFIIAQAFLEGRLGVPDPRPWMELVPGIDEHYSVFPLGAVLMWLPAALLSWLGLFEDNPAHWIAALQGSALLLLSFNLARAYDLSRTRSLLLALYMAFGTWAWPNIVFGGAWHLVLGFALLAELGLIYFLRVKRSAFWAGVCFAVAFGNRTEILVITPFVLGLILTLEPWTTFRALLRRVALFTLVPAVLLIATAAYNYARFESVFDMGYTRIAYVNEEAGFEHGLLSLHCIPMNSRTMLFTPWRKWVRFPYYVPNGFGESIVLCSPFLLFMLARGARHPRFKAMAWIVVALLTLALWIHANPGGWQYSYRYAMVVLPWAYVLILESSPACLSRGRAAVFLAAWGLSIATSAWAIYAFYWGKHVG